MSVPSLKDMAYRAAKKNAKEIDDIGATPIELFAPILEHIVDPAQLLRLQRNSPHLASHTAEKWKEFIMRDIPSWTRNQVHPSRPELWWKVYRHVKQKAVEESEAALRAGYADHAAKRGEQRIHYVPELILPSTKKSRSKKTPARSAITNAVMKDVAKARMGRPVLATVKAPPRQLKHEGLGSVRGNQVQQLAKTFLDQKDEEIKASRAHGDIPGLLPRPEVTEELYDPLGLWGPPTRVSKQTTPVGIPNEPIQKTSTSASPERNTAHSSPVRKIHQAQAITSPSQPACIVKRPAASITRGPKRTRFS